jgi:glycosyltransferase involved in cell wall biosynthesis
MTIWIDVTTLLKWKRPPVGIIKAELEFCKFALSSISDIHFCKFLLDKNKYVYVHFKDVLDSINLISGEAFIKIQQRTKLSSHNKKKLFAKTDTYISLGLDWDDKNYEELYNLKKSIGFRVILFCYDLVPIKFPHLCAKGIPEKFILHFSNLAWCADRVVCISNNSKRDFISYCESFQLPLPKLSVVNLGVEPSKGDFSTNSSIQSLIHEPYLLVVSTLEKRKNHYAIYQAYIKLFEKKLKYLPKLIFVGMRGWGVEELIFDINNDPRVLGQILYFDNLSDQDVAILYKHCLFTIYPSIYEGWGLPIAESLAYGKFCIASNVSAHKEVGKDFVDYLDPFDIIGWSKKILFYLASKKALKSRESNINYRYKIRSWSNFSRDLYNSTRLK